DIGSMVTAGCNMGFKSGVMGYKMAEAINKGDKTAVTKIIAQLGEAISAGLDMAGTMQNTGRPAAQQNEDWSKASAAVSQLLAAPSVVEKVYNACKNGKPSEAFGAIKGAVTMGVGTVIKYKVGDASDDINEGIKTATDLEEQIKTFSGE